MRFAWLALALVAACSFPTKHFTGGGDGGGGGGGGGGDGPGSADARTVDAPGGDAGTAFGCANQPFPTNAPPQIALGGTVEAGPNQPIAGDSVTGTDLATGAQFFNAISDPNGVFGMMVNTNGQAIQGYLTTQNGPPGPCLYYPRHPFYASDQQIVIYAYTPTMLQQIYSLAGAPYSSNNATIFMKIVDCNGSPVAGARLQGAAGTSSMIRYVQNGMPAPGAVMTDSSGEVLVLDVPPNSLSGFNVTGPSGQQYRTYQYPQIPPGSQISAVVQP